MFINTYMYTYTHAYIYAIYLYIGTRIYSIHIYIFIMKCLISHDNDMLYSAEYISFRKYTNHSRANFQKGICKIIS